MKKELVQKTADVKNLLSIIQEITNTNDEWDEGFDLNEAEKMYYEWKGLFEQVKNLETEFGNMYALKHNNQNK